MANNETGQGDLVLRMFFQIGAVLNTVLIKTDIVLDGLLGALMYANNTLKKRMQLIINIIAILMILHLLYQVLHILTLVLHQLIVILQLVLGPLYRLFGRLWH